AARAQNARRRQTYKKRVGPQCNDVVYMRRDVFREIQQRTDDLMENGFRTLARSQADEGSMVNPLDRRRERRRLDSRRDGTQQLRDRPRRPRGALALGPRGEQLGVALVQADDSFSEPVGSEDLGPSALALRIDLVEIDPLYLVGADIERHIIRGAGVHPVTQQ